METKKKRRRQDRKKETWREISGCDLGKLRVNIYFPSLGLSVVTWCLPTHTAAIQRCLSPPPLCLWWHDLHCGILLHNTNTKWDTYTVGVRIHSHSHTHLRTHMGTHKQTKYTCLVKAFLCWRTDYQLSFIPGCFALFLFFVCMSVCVLVHVCVH